MERIQAGQINLSPIAALRPPPAARSRAQLYATGDPRSPRHGLESPCHVARAFQPVGLGRPVRSAIRRPSSALRSLLSKILPCVPCVPWANPPSSCICLPVIYPILAPFALLCGQPSVLRPPSSAREDAPHHFNHALEIGLTQVRPRRQAQAVIKQSLGHGASHANAVFENE